MSIGLWYDRYIYTYEPFIRQCLESNSSNKDNQYYHYTSVSNCLNLIKEDGNKYEMWASNVKYLNDKDEYLNGYNIVKDSLEDNIVNLQDALLKNRWKEFIESSDEASMSNLSEYLNNDLYILCFCRDGNLLSQWKYYGKESGVAIEYDLEHCEFTGYIGDSSEFHNNVARQVEYEDDKKKSICQKLIEKAILESDKNYDKKEIIADMWLSILLTIIPFFKHKAFIEEKEHRLVFQPLYINDPNSIEKLINFRERDGIFIPYLKIQMRNKNPNERLIKSITVGPGKNQDLAFQSIAYYIRSKYSIGSSNEIERTNKETGYSYITINGVEIRKSMTPFRG